jgi:hypothetical protein
MNPDHVSHTIAKRCVVSPTVILVKKDIWIGGGWSERMVQEASGGQVTKDRMWGNAKTPGQPLLT